MRDRGERLGPLRDETVDALLHRIQGPRDPADLVGTGLRNRNRCSAADPAGEAGKIAQGSGRPMHEDDSRHTDKDGHQGREERPWVCAGDIGRMGGSERQDTPVGQFRRAGEIATVKRILACVHLQHQSGRECWFDDDHLVSEGCQG